MKHMEFLFLIRVIAPLRQPPVVNEGGCWFINENLRSSGEHGGYEVRELPRAAWEGESVKREYSTIKAKRSFNTSLLLLP